jgi:hypothetical protein
MALTHTTQLDFVVGELVLLDGRRQSEAVHMAVLTPPRRAARDRRHETLFVFLDLGGGGGGGLARAMLEHFGRAFWRSSGAVTTALRQAIRTANTHLQEENRLMAVGQRRQGGLICAVLRDDLLYLAQAGPVKALLLQGDKLSIFPGDSPSGQVSEARADVPVLARPPERLPLGVSSAPDVQFIHRFLHPGDRMLLTGASWSEELTSDALADVLAQDTIENVMLALERRAQRGAFSALVIGCVPRASWSGQPEPTRSSTEHIAAPPSRISATRQSAVQPTPKDDMGEQLWEPTPQRRRALVPLQRERLEQAREGLKKARQVVGDGTHALLTRVLPEPELTPVQRNRRARKSWYENVPVMAGIAVAIPLLVAFVVVTFYLQRSASARREALVEQAHEAVQVARETQGESSRARWDAALQAAQDALLVAPHDQEILALRDEARAMLDVLGGIIRPDLIALWDYGTGAERRLAAGRMHVYVLDPNQVTQHGIDEARSGVTNDQLPLVAYRGEMVGEREIGALRDATWLSSGGAWVGDALFLLTQDNQLLQYSLSWGLSWAPFDTGLAHVSPYALRPFDGKLYVLDREQGQIWRFPSSADGFGPPDGYFAAAAPDLSQVIDMTIDGAVYLLLGDGHIRKYLSGEEQPFQISGLPQPLVQPVALVHEGDIDGGALYVGDAGAQSIVALTKDGRFLFQIQSPISSTESTGSDALVGIEALAVEEESRMLYVLAQGRLYALALPPLPSAQ